MLVIFKNSINVSFCLKLLGFFTLCCFAHAQEKSKWFTNGNVISEVNFEKLQQSHRIYIAKSLHDFKIDDAKKIKDRLPQKIIENLIQIYSASSNNVAVKKFLQTKLLLDEVSSQTLANKIELLVQNNQGKTIQEILDEKNLTQYKPLIERKDSQGLILEQGDRIGSIIIEKFGKTEDIVEVHGRVKGSVNNMKLEADKIVVNSKIMNVLATGNLRLESGNIVLRGERAMFNIDTQRGFLINPKGKVDLIHFSGSIGKFNSGEHVTLLDAQGDVEGNPEGLAPFNFSASTVESFGKEKIILNNLFLYIHDVPVFYFPVGFQNPFGTGIDLRYGYTDQEGLFFQNNFSIKVPVIGEVKFELDFYEKVGLYFQIQNSGSFSKSSYNAAFAIAQTKEGKNSFSKGKMHHYGFFEPSFEENNMLRFKYNFDQSFKLSSKKAAQKDISTSLNYKIAGTRYVDSLGVLRHDPYFSSEIESRNPRQFKYIDLIKTSPYYESILYPTASDKDQYGFSFIQTFPGSSLTLKGDLNYFLIQAKDPSIPITSYTKLPQKQYLGKISLPVVDFSYSGTIDPIQEDDEITTKKSGTKNSKRLFLNMNYTITGNYKYESFYEFSNKLGTSEFLRNQNNFNIAFSTSRNWNLQKNRKEEFFNISELAYGISFNTGYNRQWGGDEIDNKYREANKNNTYFQLSFSQNATAFFPSKHMREKLSIRAGYFSIIPHLEISSQYNIGLKHFFEADASAKGKNARNTFPDVWENHSVSSSIKANQNLYGIFFIPGFDMDHSASSSVRYDIREDLKSKNDTRLFFLDQERIQSWGLDYSSKIYYKTPVWQVKVFEARYDFRQEILNSQSKKLSPRPLYQSISCIIQYQKPKDTNFKIPWEEYVSFKEAYLKTAYNYYFGEKSYKQDSFSVGIGTKIDILKFIGIHIYVDSGTSQAYLYTYYKASSFQEDSVNFFYDVFQSMGFIGTDETERFQNRMDSILKLKKVGISVSQDMGSWTLEISYSINPKPLGVPGVVKGFYMNQEISLNINLKGDYTVFKLLRETIQPWKLNIKPRILDQL